jgi:hypothetical protein
LNFISDQMKLQKRVKSIPLCNVSVCQWSILNISGIEESILFV